MKGQVLRLQLRPLLAFITFGVAVSAAHVPAGQILEVRLLETTSSRSSKVGQKVRSVLIAPVIVDGDVTIPAGAQVEGQISTVAKFGFGVKNSHARIGYRFDTLRLENGKTASLDAQLVRVDSAREHVDEIGQVHGISPVVSASSALAFYAWRLVMLEPVVGTAVWGTKFLFAPAPDPEVTLPAGTELLLKTQVTADVPVEEPSTVVFAFAAQNLQQFGLIANGLGEGRVRRKSGELGDRLNLMFVGTRPELESAFGATGWVGAERRSPVTFLKTYFSVEKREGRPTAAMAPMSLDGRLPDLVFQKSLNTFSRRHHLRLWQTDHVVDGRPVWVGSATEDVGVSFSKESKRWVHDIDTEIDNERAKVLNDLMFTGCVSGVGLVMGAPADDPTIATDGRFGVAQFHSCSDPRQMPIAPKDEQKDNIFVRGFTSLARDMSRTNAMTLGLATARIGPVAKAFVAGQRPSLNARKVLAGQQAAWLAARGGVL
jgi:hypothetical protein